jgi:hypothetical protein
MSIAKSPANVPQKHINASRIGSVPVLGADRECYLCVPPSPIDAPMTTSLAPAMNRLRTKQRNFTGSGIALFKMKHPKRQLGEQYQLAGDAVLFAPVSRQIPC